MVIRIYIVYMTAIGVGGATLIGGIFGFIFKNFSEKHGNSVMLFSAGVMLSTSVFNLILPSLNNTENSKNYVSVAGVFCGAVCVVVINYFIKKIISNYENILFVNCENPNEINKILLFITAVAIHNFPEGIAAGVGFGTDNISDALAVAGSIALQNLPEGMIVISPMLSMGFSRKLTLFIALATAFSEILGTILGYYAVSLFGYLLPFFLSFAGGTMLYVICDDIIPDSKKSDSKNGSSIPLLSGFCLMIIINFIIC